MSTLPLQRFYLAGLNDCNSVLSNITDHYISLWLTQTNVGLIVSSAAATFQRGHMHPGGPFYIGHSGVDESENKGIRLYQGAVRKLDPEMPSINLGL